MSPPRDKRIKPQAASTSGSGYGKSPETVLGHVDAPALNYLPPAARRYRPNIGLIGAGGVTEYHLRAYQKLELDVVAICDTDLNRARARRDQFYPGAAVCTDYREVLSRPDIEVIDAALHPEPRAALLEAAIGAGKHVLSQKPFAVNLDLAERLVALAKQRGVKLAVNQNGRWAPHFAYAREALRTGLLGTLGAVDFNLGFDHSWTIGTPFEQIHHLLLYDFGIHWFDLAACLLGDRRAKSVFASVAKTSYQRAKSPFLASVVIDADEVQIRMAFNAAVVHGQSDRTVVAGSLGTLCACGPSLSVQRVTLSTEAGECSPALTGTWFENGFQGTMGELLCAIEAGREPSNSAAQNLRSLELCFAALHSANTGLPTLPGSIRRLPA